MLIAAIKAMMHSPVHNYVIPGLTSWLVGEKGENGFVRVFTMSRNHEEPIVPHSHRFDFVCKVLKGGVRNRIWSTCDADKGDLYQQSIVSYEGTFGQHKLIPLVKEHWKYSEFSYGEGDEYGMTAEEVHSIYFEKGSMVLFFEGKARHPASIVLEPVVDGQTIPLMRTDPWMFRRS